MAVRTSREIRDYLEQLWEDAPVWITLTKEMSDYLAKEKERTRKGTIALLKSRSDVPRGLKAQVLQNWFTRRVKRCRKDYYDFVVSAYAALPDAKTRNKDKIALTSALIDKIRAEQDRTGIGTAALARHLPSQRRYIKSDISRWINGHVSTASKRDLELALGVWAKLPTRKVKTNTDRLNDGGGGFFLLNSSFKWGVFSRSCSSFIYRATRKSPFSLNSLFKSVDFSDDFLLYSSRKACAFVPGRCPGL